jgi:hypothetical protein
MLQVTMRYSAGEKYSHRDSVPVGAWEASNTIQAAMDARQRMREWANDPALVVVWRDGRGAAASDATLHCDRGVVTMRVWVRG